MSEELKACPFCGSEATYYDGVLCSNANCPLNEEPPYPFVLHSWNTRPIEDALRKQLENAEYGMKLANEGFATIEKQDTTIRKQLDIAVKGLNMARSEVIQYFPPHEYTLAIIDDALAEIKRIGGEK